MIEMSIHNCRTISVARHTTAGGTSWLEFQFTDSAGVTSNLSAFCPPTTTIRGAESACYVAERVAG